MKSDISSLGVFGGKPCFNEVLPLGQHYKPSWPRFKRMLQGILERQYYTNHGPLAQELEDKLCQFMNVKNAVTITNENIGLMLLLKSMNIKGKIIMPAFSFPGSIEAVRWAGLEPIFCDIEPHTHLIDPEKLSNLIKKFNVCALYSIHLWGNICNHAITNITKKHSLPVIYDATHAFGCKSNESFLDNTGTVTIFSFNSDNILNSGEGGCVCTNDDNVAECLRNIRSSYGRRKHVEIPIGGYGRFSEVQAGMALLSLEDFMTNCNKNIMRYERYSSNLQKIPGIKLLSFPSNIKSNYQCVCLEIDEAGYGLSQDYVMKILVSENIQVQSTFTPGLNIYNHSNSESNFGHFEPVAKRISSCFIQLPSGQYITNKHIDNISDLLTFLHTHATDIRQFM